MLSFFDAGISSPFGCPPNWTDILISPFIFCFFGVMMFIGAVRYEQSYDKVAKWWKWCFVPVGIGLLLGIQRVSFLRDFTYVQTVTTRKLLLSHWFGFIVPLICVAAIILYKRIKQRTESRRVY